MCPGSFSNRFFWHLVTELEWKSCHCLGEIKRKPDLILLMVCIIKCWCLCGSPKPMPPDALAFLSLVTILTLPTAFPFLCSNKSTLAPGLFTLPTSSTSSELLHSPHGSFFSHPLSSAYILFLQTGSLCICLYKGASDPMFRRSRLLSQNAIWWRCVSIPKSPVWFFSLGFSRPICFVKIEAMSADYFPDTVLTGTPWRWNPSHFTVEKMFQRLQDMPGVTYGVNDPAGIHTQAMSIELLATSLNSEAWVQSTT